MLKRKDIAEYAGLSFEEFLSDDFFVQSNLYPTEKTDLFWGEFEQKNEGQPENYIMAKKCIHELNKDVLDNRSVTRIWENIRDANRRSQSKKYYRIGFAVAASIAVLLVLRIFAPQKENISHCQDIVTFAQRTGIITDSTTTQLILSDNSVVSISERESVIVYDSASIIVSSREISKRETSAFHQLFVPKGKRLSLTLSDGTKIWVNAGTRLVYPVEFDKKKREIYVDGEIYLDVVSKIDHPFMVKTSDMEVEVTGTEFNVEAYSHDILKRVVLQSGSVKVHSGTNSDFILQPDEMYEKDGDHETVSQVDVTQYISWVKGYYKFENVSFEQIAKHFERVYGIVIRFEDESLKTLLITGTFLMDQPIETALELLGEIRNFQYSIKGNHLIISP